MAEEIELESTLRGKPIRGSVEPFNAPGLDGFAV
jgi:hypothetical protein